ncbi:glycoside hydrolase family 3 N-terminal domain-containing protein [Cesiribacter sp. SM1]|uniref:glycoside hydrolase family 3 N-terminal domain-containing protein n=1 Tax=Cesiribacter sp. SM1 TaxID=2861196 RepID=UPI001CD2DDEB|nr:glycoside hydrolase family 3 N-terminal domain-containing protein [Cesiribacter sp. SM1]
MFGKVCAVMALCVMGLTAAWAGTPPDSTSYKKWAQQRDHWVDSVMNSMTEEQRIGQLFMVAAYSNRDMAHLQELEQLVVENHIGGLIFFQGGPVRQARMTNYLQSKASVPLFIAMDAEWGLGMRLDSIQNFPRQMTLGAIEDNQLIYTMGAEVARQLKLLGVHINFAPVVDVNSNPNNPVIGTRSFGEYKFDVARKGVAYMRGLQDGGVLASAKHFPGHGDTDADSHLSLPVIKHDMERLRSIELYPFQQLIGDSIASVMVAHLYVPALDNTPNRATTLSPAVVSGLLRKEMGYSGLIFTDALNMKGVSQYYKPGDVDVAALKAGNDVLLFSEDVAGAIRKIRRAVKRGEITQKSIDEHTRRILQSKYWANLDSYTPINTDNLLERLNDPVGDMVRQKLYEHAVSIVHNQRNLLPIRHLEDRNFAAVTIGGDIAKNKFVETLELYAPFEHFHISKDASAEQFKALEEKLKPYDVVVVGVHDMMRAPEKNFGLAPNQLSFINDIRRHPNAVIAVFGSPYSLKHFEEARTLVLGYEDNSFTQEIVPSVIFGGLPAKGKLPVSVSGLVRRTMGERTQDLARLSYATPEDVGMDSKVLENIDRIAEEAVKLGATPGMQILVARKGSIIYQKNFGHLSYDSLNPVTNETVYDIASITKVAATLQVMMFMEERGLVDLDKPIVEYLEDLKGTNKADLKLRDILAHQSGLVPYIPFWKNTLLDAKLNTAYYSSTKNDNFSLPVAGNIYTSRSMQDSIWQWIKKSDLLPKPRGKKNWEYKYSDVGYYIMQRIAEKMLNQPMAEFLAQNFYEPLGLESTTYLPLSKYSITRIAPTELDNYFRNGLVYGMVHDQGAAMMGGIAGHAGIFSNATDLAVLMQMNLQDGYYGGKRYFAPGTVERFAKAQFKGNRRGLGWDKPEMNSPHGPTSNMASPGTFGHTGFTGTAAWVDPEFELVYIFLSNRVHPDANNTKLIRFGTRTRIMDEIYKAMQSFNKYNQTH